MRILGHKPSINTSYCTGHSLELKYFHFLQFLCFFFAQDSIRNMWFCSYVIFWLRKLKLKYGHMYCNQQKKWWQERNFEKCTLQQALSEVILMQLDLWRYIFSGSKRVPLCLCQGLKFDFYGFFFVLLDHTLLKQKYCSSIFSVWHAMHYVKLNKFSNQLILASRHPCHSKTFYGWQIPAKAATCKQAAACSGKTTLLQILAG